MALEFFLRMFLKDKVIIQSEITGVSVKSTIPELLFEGRPNFSYFSTDFSVFHNSQGLRDYEYSFIKPNNTFRILVLGDSVTYGVYVNQNNTYVKELEYLLNMDSRIKYEVINAGVGGYNTYQEFVWLDNIGRLYHPDMILVGYDYSDIINVSLIEEKKSNKETLIFTAHVDSTPIPVIIPFPKIINSFLIKKVYIYRYFNLGLYSIITKLNIKFSFYIYNDGIEMTRIAINKFKEYSSSNNQSLLFVNFPALTRIRDKHDLLALNLLEEGDVVYLDLFFVFQNFGMSNLKLSPADFIHPNQKGHQIAAEEIYKYLVINCLIPDCHDKESIV
ncbi:MAG: SGNH/GDSL hydrolase family protein [Nanoarchaeota archaeon]|nr:SGNH/GDSL hydrolase family protein [Nanoarchaeota archaeon]